MVRKYLSKDFFIDNEQIMSDLYVEHREISMHTHEFWEISYIYEGKGTHYFSDGTTLEIKEGDCVIINPGAAHCITSPPSEKVDWVRACNILMTAEYASSLISRFSNLSEFKDMAFLALLEKNEPFCIQVSDTSEAAKNLFMTAVYEYRNKLDGSQYIMDSTSLNILIYMARLYDESITGEKNEDIKNETANDVIKYIRSNYGKNITLDYLAAMVHMAPAYLSRYFKKHTGKTISEFIVETRVANTKRLLRETDYSIAYIGDYCGFRTSSSFQKAFKKQAGITASEYRKNNKR